MSEEGFEAALTRIWMGIKRPTLGHQDPASKSALSNPRNAKVPVCGNPGLRQTILIPKGEVVGPLKRALETSS